MSRPKKKVTVTAKRGMRHIFFVDSRSIAEVKWKQIDDGLEVTIFYPNIGHVVRLNGVDYGVVAITHDYDSGIIGYHFKISDSDKPTP